MPCLFRVVAIATCLLLPTTSATRGDEPPADQSPAVAETPAPRTPQQAVTRALTFLKEDAAKWRRERGCATCHHGTMTVWALSEARAQGHAVDAATLADTMQWAKERFIPRVRAPRDARPGWSLVSIPGIYLGAMSHSLPVLSREEIGDVASHLARHQEGDGTWMLPAAANGAPPTWESPETLVLWALLAWEPTESPDAATAASMRAAREKAVAWLQKAEPTNSQQALALRLVTAVRTKRPEGEVQPLVAELLRRQASDGGWSQAEGSPTDAYATGQTLWALSVAGVSRDRPEVQRAVAFLAATQREDGSWAMPQRRQPSDTSTRQRNPIPITYFGACWGTIGLVRFVPPVLDAATARRLAEELIREYSGTSEVDEASPDKPVTGVRIVYQVDDQELAKLASRLEALPKLESLKLKSPRMTDAGLLSLKRLQGLRHLSLEDAPVTDAGLAQLQALPHLATVNLKGTKVTDAGVAEFQKGKPAAKIER